MAKHYPDRYIIAMSEEDGCLVMLKNDVVVGSMTREQTIRFAQDTLAWEVPIPKPLQALNGHGL
jgi:hypothetical protein